MLKCDVEQFVSEAPCNLKLTSHICLQWGVDSHFVKTEQSTCLASAV